MDLFTLKDLNNWIIDVRNIIIGLNICVNFKRVHSCRQTEVQALNLLVSKTLSIV